MYEERVGSFFLVLTCLLKLASLHYIEVNDCIFPCAGENSTNINSAFSKQVNISDDITKIIRKRNLSELRPLPSNNSVQFSCTAQHNSTFEVKNFTEKIGSYCNDSSSAELSSKTLGEPVTITIPDLYKTSNYSTVWYKDCKEYLRNASEISFTSVQQADSAVYTYMISHMYNGENYSICGKKWLTVNVQKKENLITKLTAKFKRQQQPRKKVHIENIKSKIIGVGDVTITEVEIGQNHSIKCEASVVDYEKRFKHIYWIRTNKSNVEDINDLLDPCTADMSKTCIMDQVITGSILSTELRLINISDDDIKYPYICKLDSEDIGDHRQFILKLKDKNRDISKKVFTTSIIASITCSVCTVFLIGLCMLFRIHIVLLYRSISGVDETIGDGKEFDAYLSFESFSTCESDERHFAWQTLAPILENCFGYKLCIFERDVVPGGALFDDMNSFLEKSRRLIIVLSKGFTSCEAMYELESGLHKAMVERKIKVILIEFTPLSEQRFQIESLQLLTMKNRVKWKGVKSRPLNSRFWKKIQYLMPAKPIRSCSSFTELKPMQTDDNGVIIF